MICRRHLHPSAESATSSYKYLLPVLLQPAFAKGLHERLKVKRVLFVHLVEIPVLDKRVLEPRSDSCNLFSFGSLACNEIVVTEMFEDCNDFWSDSTGSESGRMFVACELGSSDLLAVHVHDDGGMCDGYEFVFRRRFGG